MRYRADVVHQSVHPSDGDPFDTVPIEGDAYEVAQRVAELAARRRYGDDGFVGYVACVGEDRFLGAIGVYERRGGQGVTRGVTISIHCRRAG